MNRPGSIPRAPLLLGLAGLIPFWGLALGVGIAPAAGLPAPGVLAFALAAYGAVIVSFLGGIRWGLATTRPNQEAMAVQYGVAIVPSLLAWAALALPMPAALGALGLVGLLLGLVDQGLVRNGLAPAWFGRLRLILSGGAGAALLVAAATAFVRL